MGALGGCHATPALAVAVWVCCWRAVGAAPPGAHPYVCLFDWQGGVVPVYAFPPCGIFGLTRRVTPGCAGVDGSAAKGGGTHRIPLYTREAVTCALWCRGLELLLDVPASGLGRGGPTERCSRRLGRRRHCDLPLRRRARCLDAVQLCSQLQPLLVRPPPTPHPAFGFPPPPPLLIPLGIACAASAHGRRAVGPRSAASQ